MIWKRDNTPPEPDKDKPARPRAPRPGLPRRMPAPVPSNRPGRTFALWALIVVVTLLIANLYFGARQARIDISYTRFVEEIEKGNIAKLDIVEKEVTGELKTSSSIEVARRPVPLDHGQGAAGSPSC